MRFAGALVLGVMLTLVLGTTACAGATSAPSADASPDSEAGLADACTDCPDGGAVIDANLVEASEAEASSEACGNTPDGASPCSFCNDELVCFGQQSIACPVVGSKCCCGEGGVALGGVCEVPEGGSGGVWGCSF
jgi:hypothetical protein